MNYGLNRYHQPNDRHIALVFIAILLSFAAHFCFMYFYGDMSIGASSEIVQKIRQTFQNDRFPPMHVDSMKVDPLKMLPRIKGERETPSRGPMDVSTKVEGLRQSPPPALTAPPPIPREALTPGVPALKEAIAEKVDTTPWVPRQEIKQIYDRIVQDDMATLPRREIPMIERIAKAPDMVPSIDLAGRSFGKDPEPPKAFESAEIFSDQMTKGSVTIPLPKAPINENESLATAATAKKFAIKQNERSGKVRAGSEMTDSAAVAETKKALENAAKKGTPSANPKEGQIAAETNKKTLTPVEKRAKETQKQIATIQENVEYVPIDDLLSIGMESYKDSRDPSKIYFQIQIQPNQKKAMPSVPKDIVFVQDVSGSMGFKGRDGMQSYRRGLSNAIKTLNTGDRFNIVTFRESFSYCFPDTWAAPTPENYRKAEEFIKGVHAYGNTDLFASMKALAELPRDPRRPMIVFVITDGVATSGLVRNAEIISEFSQLNNGMMSVYMFGTRSNSNAYLLDMLTYCNRGNFSLPSRTLSSWDIPDKMQEEVEKIRNPLMGDIMVVFDSASAAEVYPQNTPNLYRDRPLLLSGVCPSTTKEIVFQIRGLAATKGYDSVFRLPISQVHQGTKRLKLRWAQQKMYHLAGEYSRHHSPALLGKMREIHSQFSIPIPYEKKLK